MPAGVNTSVTSRLSQSSSASEVATDGSRTLGEDRYWIVKMPTSKTEIYICHIAQSSELLPAEHQMSR